MTAFELASEIAKGALNPETNEQVIDRLWEQLMDINGSAPGLRLLVKATIALAADE